MKRLAVLTGLLVLTCYLPPLPNNRPDPPVIIGPSEGFADSTYTFTLLGKDPDSNNIKVRVAWGEGDTSDWTPFIHSGETTEVTHAWSSPGTYALRAQAMDWKDSVSDWSKARVINVTTAPDYPFRVVAVIESVYPMDMSFTRDGELAYATDLYAVSVIRTSDHTLLRRIPTPGLELWGIAVLPDGDYVYAGTFHRILVIRTSDDSVVAEIPTPWLCCVALAPHPSGTFVYAAYEDIGFDSEPLLKIRTSDNSLDSITFSFWPEEVAVSADGRYVLVSDDHESTMEAARTSDDSIIGRAEAGGVIASSPDGRYVYLADKHGTIKAVETHGFNVVHTACVGRPVWDITILPDGRYIYLSSESRPYVSVVRASDLAVVDSLYMEFGAVGGGPSGIAADPQGRFVYAYHWDVGEIRVLAR